MNKCTKYEKKWLIGVINQESDSVALYVDPQKIKDSFRVLKYDVSSISVQCIHLSDRKDVHVAA